MTVPRIGSRDVGRLTRALRESGYGVIEWTGEAPWWFFLGAANDPPARQLLVYMWPLRDAGTWTRPNRKRVGLHRRSEQPFELYEGAMTLLLGYSRDDDLYVGWPVERYLHAASGSSAWVDESALRAARTSGFALDRSRGAAAFRPERFGDYLELAAAPDVHELEIPVERLAPRRPLTRYSIGVAATRPATGRERGKDVATGFSTVSQPERELSPNEPLEPAAPFYYWFGVGIDSRRSIETDPTPLPIDELPDEAYLTVQLFGFDGELALVGETRGEIRLTRDGAAVVTRPGDVVSDDDELHTRKLFFEIRTPEAHGPQRLRCSVYHGSTLVQSRLVTAQVGDDVLLAEEALRSQLDYSLTDELNFARIAHVPDHLLSVTVNGDGDTHQFRFFSRADGKVFTHDSSVGQSTVQTAITDARGELRKAAWGTRDEWKGESFKYETVASLERFKTDLVELARRGRTLYTSSVSRQLVGGIDERERLEAIAAKAGGEIQIAMAYDALYLPVGLFYDHKLDDTAEVGAEYDLCDQFTAALDSGNPLEDLTCFTEGCPSRDELRVVCASGFWGYRHEIGWPVGHNQTDFELESDPDPELAVGISTDAKLKRAEEHAAQVLTLGTGEIARSRDTLTALLKGRHPSLVYLYCHGGVDGGGRPFLEIGAPGSAAISESYFSNHEIRWEGRRPLAFINGCNTTAIEPRQLVSLVGGFVAEAKAAGVIGTEITVFEPLACRFAEVMLEGFLAGSATVGRAVRRARLQLLSELNPLGLVYIPFVAAPTRLVRAAAPPA